ncbi:MAG: hypothetical protein ABSC94_05465 [Polyangiaceae bacterium]|jgi:hypothetical protein
MAENRLRVSSQSPYRMTGGPRDAKSRDEVSVGFVTWFVLFLVVLIQALSAGPWPENGFGRSEGRPCLGHSPVRGHHAATHGIEL